MESFLFQATIYLAAAVLAVPLASRFGLGSVLGYLIAGIVIGPLTGLVGSETRDLQHFAEFGVVMMLFVVGIANLLTLVGLSPALGTFLAGVVLANSEFRHELEADIEPFKGLLLGLFFITVGAGINFDRLFGEFGTVIGLTFAVIALKGAILAVLGGLSGLRGANRWLFALALAQAGEFGFVMLSFSVQQDVISRDLSETLLLVVALSMLLTPLLFMLHEFLERREKPADDERSDDIEAQGKVIIAGVGRFGQTVDRIVQASGFETTVLDKHLETIELMRAFGARVFLGDPTRPDLLKAAGLAKAQVLVVALDDPAACLRLVEHVRRERADLHIIARAHDREAVFRPYRAGADKIVRELFDSSLRAGRYTIEALGFSDHEAAQQELAFYRHDRTTNQQLAPLWDPDLPLLKNAASSPGRARSMPSWWRPWRRRFRGRLRGLWRRIPPTRIDPTVGKRRALTGARLIFLPPVPGGGPLRSGDIFGQKKGRSAFGDAGFGEGGHAAVAGDGGLYDGDGQRGTRGFAKAHVERQERRLVQTVKQAGVRGFGRHVARDRVVQRAGPGAFQRGGGGGADEAVEDHRDAFGARARDRAGHRRQFAPTQAAQHLQRVAVRVGGQRLIHDAGFQRQPGVVQAGAAPGPVAGRPAKQRRRDGRRGGGIADPHFAHHQQVGAGIDRVPAR